jgi:hypothetical protein
VHNIDVQQGVNWTTDAVYMEHKQKIDLYRRAGVITVDMELSAIFTVARVRGIQAAAIVAVSDELHGDEGSPGRPYCCLAPRWPAALARRNPNRTPHPLILRRRLKCERLQRPLLHQPRVSIHRQRLLHRVVARRR